MLTTLGLALAPGGAVTAFGARTKLRGESCPSCESIGTLALVQLDFDDCPGRIPIATRSRLCAAGGCMVIDRSTELDRPRLARLVTIAALDR